MANQLTMSDLATDCILSSLEHSGLAYYALKKLKREGNHEQL